jgi:hypothetical protein
MLSAPDLELFAVHLAIHLCGADPIRQRVSEKEEFQLYWRSPLLQKGSTTIDSRANGARRLLFVDVTFDFGWRLNGTCTARDDTREDSDSLICYRFGSLWENAASKDSAATADAAVYYTGAPTQGVDLERHFMDASIDEASTPAPILAQSFALALQGFTATSWLDRGNHALADSAITQERVVPLYYSDVDSWADWNVGGEQSSAVSGPVLQMIVLQQQMMSLSLASANEASSAHASNTNEVGQLCNLILEEWKPAMLRELRKRRAQQPAVEKAVPVATTDIPQSVPSSKPTIDDDDTAAAESERAVSTASTTSQPLPTIAATAAAATDVPSVRPSTASVSKKVVKKKGAAHGFAKINAKKPKRGGLQFAD